jgi:chromosome segregation ATPase
MTTPTNQHPGTPTAQHQDFSLERISRLVADLEQELAKAPGDVPHVQDLKEEIQALKHVLASPEDKDDRIGENLHAVRTAFQNMTARVEGEVLKDSPYIAEIGRILGMV